MRFFRRWAGGVALICAVAGAACTSVSLAHRDSPYLASLLGASSLLFVCVVVVLTSNEAI